MHHLTLSRLTCARGDYHVFRDLNAELHTGGCVFVKGANGCGKTSLLRMIAGLLTAEAGTIMLDNKPIRESQLRGLSLYCALTHTLKPDLDLLSNLNVFTSLYGYDSNIIVPALKDLGLETLVYTPANQLSAGMQRRAILARLAIARRAEGGQRPIWLLDEPEDSLDSDGLGRVNALLDAHHKDGGLSIIASHRVAIDTHVNTTINLDTQRIE
jgi:heme exporter protein A